MSRKKSAWRVWAKALGEKAGKNDREADTVAIIRTAILVSYMVTNVAIVANAVRHWNDVPNQNQSLIPKIGQKKIRPNFSPRRFFMSKGFKPTEHKKPMPKNLKSALNRVGKELKNALRNPVVIAANLDKKKTD